MLLIKAKRVIKAGFVNFWRNGWVSLATVLIMVVTLFSIGSLIFARAILGSMISQIQDKVDITIYFKTDALEQDTLALKDSLSKLSEVRAVDYVSAEQNLEKFRERHKDNALIAQSLEELGENPLGATLNVKAKETSQYEAVAKFLESESKTASGSIIDKINYFQNKKIIDRLSKILDSSKKLGSILSLVLIAISIIITFNTIRMAIYISREEIGVMRLVGASSRFVAGPFIIEGIMYGVISAIVTTILFYPLSLWLGPLTENFFSGINLFRYYVSNLGQIFLVLLLVGAGLGSISSFIAVRRYLKV
ncbi:MAG: FtsX-like permease family protein [Candidatus Terrybacteria bacterium]|nr:FtsX-like permease family protein [Candidatus Terrybacteria bacterium]